jgi:cation transport regulator ChaB
MERLVHRGAVQAGGIPGDERAGDGESDRERRSHMIAWAAVKRSYVKADGDWVPR